MIGACAQNVRIKSIFIYTPTPRTVVSSLKKLVKTITVSCAETRLLFFCCVLAD